MRNASVIIPTLNEAAYLPCTLAALRAQNPLEIIVVDGGSSDETLLIAKDADLVLKAERGRARQMNLGASHARGDFLVFLHADCILESDAINCATILLRRHEVSAACFTMRVEAPGLAFRCIDWCATARVRLTSIAYGDQGLAVRSDLFREIGGFPAVGFMEDILISRRLRREGRIIVLPQRIQVSARRWRRHGVVRQTLRNWLLTALAVAGVHPDWLARFYPVH